jgi:8-oxo-dGTP diphosphatase
VTEEKLFTSKYPIPGITADIAVISKYSNTFEVLLIERGDDPFKGSWALPGGFINPNENVYQGAIRELKEETAVQVYDLKEFSYINVYSEPGRDPRGWTVSHLFLYDCRNHSTYPSVRAGDDAVNHEWVTFDSIKLGITKLAFDHRDMIMEIAQRLEVK